MAPFKYQVQVQKRSVTDVKERSKAKAKGKYWQDTGSDNLGEFVTLYLPQRWVYAI